MRGVWIEINQRAMAIEDLARSLPVRGVWIEISGSLRFKAA